MKSTSRLNSGHLSSHFWLILLTVCSLTLPLKANSLSLCDWALSKKSFTGSTFEIKNSGWISPKASVKGPGFEISGKSVRIPYKMPTRNIYGQVLKIELNIRTEDGSEFLVISRDLFKDSARRFGDEEKVDLTTLADRQKFLRDKEVTEPYYSLIPDVWQVAWNNPARMGKFKVFANRDFLIVPTVPTMNRIFSTLGLHPRFREWTSFTSAGQKYESDAFLDAFAKGEILVGTKDEYFRHDFLEDHFIGALLIPPEVFDRTVRFAQFIQAVLQDPHFHDDYQIKNVREGLSAYWDWITAEFAQTDLDVRVRLETAESEDSKMAQRQKLIAFVNGESVPNLRTRGGHFEPWLGLIDIQNLKKYYLDNDAFYSRRSEEDLRLLRAIAAKFGFDEKHGLFSPSPPKK